MEIFRSQPGLCSLFLSLLEEWGAETLDWSLLRDEVFVDRFLRRLYVDPQIDEPSVSQACASLLQPSIGGLLVAPLLLRAGHFDEAEMSSFVLFAVRGQAGAYDPMSWPELLTVLEEVAFTRSEEPSHFLASMLANGWVPKSLQSRFAHRVWETCALPRTEKNLVFAWLNGQSLWPDLPCPPACVTAGLRLGGRRSASPFNSRRRGFSGSAREALG